MLRHDPLVSIVIPDFNHAPYIGEAIQSVLDQTYPLHEIVVVDDGSTDDSREVVARFGNRVRYLWQENRGLSAARNTGIRAAQGEYVGLLDADDMYEPEFLSTLVPILEGRPDAAGVYCGYRFVNHQNTPLETLSACEDLDMWLRISSRYAVVGTTGILTRHRILPKSMSSDPNRQARNRLAVMAKHFGPAPAHDSQWTPPQRRAYGHAYLASVVDYLQAHDEARASDCLREMARIYPDLLTQFNMFFQLGCGDQPKGSVGDFATLEIERRAQMLIGLLDRLFGDPPMATLLSGYCDAAYANAYRALGALSYGARQFPATRRYLRRAVAADATLALDRRVISMFVKSLLGVRLINRLQHERQRLIPRAFSSTRRET
ncbi:MAG: glycosyl transferase [Acidobacteria bacterium]|nr:glycosyl transferase [Acidobacteriota bacterium]